MNTIIILIILYFIGMVLSIWRFISFMYSIKNNLERCSDNDMKKFVIAILCIIFIVLILFSWIGFIGGVVNYYIEELDEIFFILPSRNKE